MYKEMLMPTISLDMIVERIKRGLIPNRKVLSKEDQDKLKEQALNGEFKAYLAYGEQCYYSGNYEACAYWIAKANNINSYFPLFYDNLLNSSLEKLKDCFEIIYFCETKFDKDNPLSTYELDDFCCKFGELAKIKKLTHNKDINKYELYIIGKYPAYNLNKCTLHIEDGLRIVD